VLFRSQKATDEISRYLSVQDANLASAVTNSEYNVSMQALVKADLGLAKAVVGTRTMPEINSAIIDIRENMVDIYEAGKSVILSTNGAFITIGKGSVQDLKKIQRKFYKADIEADLEEEQAEQLAKILQKSNQKQALQLQLIKQEYTRYMDSLSKVSARVDAVIESVKQLRTEGDKAQTALIAAFGKITEKVNKSGEIGDAIIATETDIRALRTEISSMVSKESNEKTTRRAGSGFSFLGIPIWSHSYEVVDRPDHASPSREKLRKKEEELKSLQTAKGALDASIAEAKQNLISEASKLNISSGAAADLRSGKDISEQGRLADSLNQLSNAHQNLSEAKEAVKSRIANLDATITLVNQRFGVATLVNADGTRREVNTREEIDSDDLIDREDVNDVVSTMVSDLFFFHGMFRSQHAQLERANDCMVLHGKASDINAHHSMTVAEKFTALEDLSNHSDILEIAMLRINAGERRGVASGSAAGR
jgi:hypothetical protein